VIQLQSILTCPECGHRSAAEMMPTDACQYFYDCAVLKFAPGHCCVFCSYGSAPCPPVQEARRAGAPVACSGAGTAPNPRW
jgi:hypothetical protein